VQPDVSPHKRIPPATIERGDLLHCRYLWEGRVQLVHNKKLIVDFDIGRPLDPDGKYYAVVDVCFRACSLTLMPHMEIEIEASAHQQLQPKMAPQKKRRDSKRSPGFQRVESPGTAPSHTRHSLGDLPETPTTAISSRGVSSSPSSPRNTCCDSATRAGEARAREERRVERVEVSAGVSRTLAAWVAVPLHLERLTCSWGPRLLMRKEGLVLGLAIAAFSVVASLAPRRKCGQSGCC
jgi:hypothetical protein